jgi:putative hydrolase of the HAD superfamily
MRPKFLYFDLGKVLVDFSVERMLAQIAAVAGISAERVRAAVFDRRLLWEHETGRSSVAEFYEAFCAATATRPDPERLTAAAGEIFDLNAPMLPLVSQLALAGYRLGILSNTCPIHWDYCARRYRLLDDLFPVHALSFRIGAVKPEAAIFEAAAAMAGCRPGEIFFVDDLPGHVAGARTVGFDAVQFVGAEALADELRRREIRFNY